jgi:hypothetical protein
LLIRAEGEGVVLVGQPSHAWLSGQLSRAWGADGFGEVRPWEEVCLAAEQHDVGMADWDLSPSLNPVTGLPHSFMEMPLGTHLTLWSRAPERLLAQSRYAALLVSMHGTALYERRNLEALAPQDAGAVRAYLDAQQRFQSGLLEDLRGDPEMAAHATPEVVRRNQRLVWTWDYLSLALCLEWCPCAVADVPTEGAPARVSLDRTPDGALTLRPWPFRAPRLLLHCEGRRLSGRFEDERAMRKALSAAPWVTLPFELTAGAPDARQVPPPSSGDPPRPWGAPPSAGSK